MPLLSPPYDTIRWNLDTSLDASDLPDAVIAPKEAEAERWVLSRVPLALTLAGDDLQRARDATAYRAAALLIDGLPNVTEEQIDLRGARVQRKAWDPAGRKADLVALAEAQLAALTAGTYAVAKPTFIAAACGVRGR